jgi:hypothetical protein
VSQAFSGPILSPYNLKRIITGVDGNFWMTGPSGSVVTYVNQIMSVTPTSLTLTLGNSKNDSGTLTVSETSYNGSWSALWNRRIVKVVQTSPGVFTVTAVGRGADKVGIRDTMQNYTKIPVTVR